MNDDPDFLRTAAADACREAGRDGVADRLARIAYGLESAESMAASVFRMAWKPILLMMAGDRDRVASGVPVQALCPVCAMARQSQMMRAYGEGPFPPVIYSDRVLTMTPSRLRFLDENYPDAPPLYLGRCDARRTCYFGSPPTN